MTIMKGTMAAGRQAGPGAVAGRYTYKTDRANRKRCVLLETSKLTHSGSTKPPALLRAARLQSAALRSLNVAATAVSAVLGCRSTDRASSLPGVSLSKMFLMARPPIPALTRQRLVDLFESEASLVYRASSRPARAV